MFSFFVWFACSSWFMISWSLWSYGLFGIVFGSKILLFSIVVFCWASLRFAEHFYILLSIVTFCWAFLHFAEHCSVFVEHYCSLLSICVLLSILAFCWALLRFAEHCYVFTEHRIFSMKMKMWWIHYSVAESIMIMYQNIEMILKSNHSSWGPKFDKSINHTRLADDFWSSSPSIFASFFFPISKMLLASLFNP